MKPGRVSGIRPWHGGTQSAFAESALRTCRGFILKNSRRTQDGPTVVAMTLDAYLELLRGTTDG